MIRVKLLFCCILSTTDPSSSILAIFQRGPTDHSESKFKVKSDDVIIVVCWTDTAVEGIPVLFVLMQETKSRISSSKETLQLIRLDVYRVN